MSITTLQRPEQRPDEFRELLDLISKAVADGVQLRGQVAARPVGLIMSLDGRVHPLLASSTYRELASLPARQRGVALREPEVRAAILAELDDAAPAWRERFPYLFALDEHAALRPPARRSARPRRRVATTALARRRRRHTARCYVPLMNYVGGDMSATREMLVHPLTVPGLGDAGAHCTMICDGSFPTYLLEYWGRDASAADRLPIEWIVQRQCADTAALVGLHDRGVLAPGRRADVNLVDLDALSVGAGRDGARPARRRTPTRAARVRLPRHARRRRGASCATASRPAPCPAASCAAPSPHADRRDQSAKMTMYVAPVSVEKSACVEAAAAA